MLKSGSPIRALHKLLFIHITILVTVTGLLVANRSGFAILSNSTSESDAVTKVLKAIQAENIEFGISYARTAETTSSNANTSFQYKSLFLESRDSLQKKNAQLKAIIDSQNFGLSDQKDALNSLKPALVSSTRFCSALTAWLNQSSLSNLREPDYNSIQQSYSQSRTDIDNAVFELSNKASADFESDFNRKSYYDFGFLLLLILESLVLLRPMVKRLYSNINELEYAKSSLESQSNQLEVQNSQLLELNAISNAQRLEMEAKQNLLEQTLSETQIANELMAVASKRFQDLFRKAPYACFTTDLEGNIYEWNENAEISFGYLGFSVFEQNAIELLASDADKHILEKLLGDAKAGVTNSNVMAQAKNANGNVKSLLWSVFPIDGANNICTGALFASIDITQEVKDQTRLKMFEAITEQNDTGILIMDDQFLITYANEAQLKLSKYTVEEMIGQSPFTLFDGPNADEAMKKEIAKALLGGDPVSSEVEIYNKYGHSHWSKLEISPVKDEYGRVTHFVGFERDITEKRHIEVAIKSSEELFRTAMNTLQTGVIIHNIDGSIQYGSLNAANMLGLSLEQLHGKSTYDAEWGTVRLDGSVLPPEEHPCTKAMSSGKPVTGDIVGVSVPKSGVSWLSVNANPIFNENEEITGSVVSFEDVTAQIELRRQLEGQLVIQSEIRVELELSQKELIQSNKLLKEQATKDGLTGLLNHKTIIDELQKKFNQSESNGDKFSIVLVDIDRFKAINDDFGHQAGDDVLRTVSQVLKSNLPPRSKVGRYGGEEFLFVLKGCDESKAKLIAEKMRISLESLPFENRQITASFGAATYSSGLENKRELIEQADQALYECKRLGRNKSLHYNTIANSTQDDRKIA